VHVRERIGADTGIRAIGHRVRVPAEVEKVVTAARAWLAAQLADWDDLDDELLGRAMSDMARQYVDQDPELGRSAASLEVRPAA